MWIAQQQYQYSPYTRQLSNRLRPLQAERTTLSPIVKTQKPTGLDKMMPKTRPIGNYQVSNSWIIFLLSFNCFAFTQVPATPIKEEFCRGRQPEEKIPFPGDSNKFIVCHLGETFDIMSCPRRLVFNIHTSNYLSILVVEKWLLDYHFLSFIYQTTARTQWSHLRIPVQATHATTVLVASAWNSTNLNANAQRALVAVLVTRLSPARHLPVEVAVCACRCLVVLQWRTFACVTTV